MTATLATAATRQPIEPTATPVNRTILLMIGHLRRACVFPTSVYAVVNRCRQTMAPCELIIVTWNTTNGARSRGIPGLISEQPGIHESSAACLRTLSQQLRPLDVLVREAESDPLAKPSAELWPGSNIAFRTYQLNLLGILLGLEMAQRHGPFGTVLRFRPDVGATGLGAAGLYSCKWDQAHWHSIARAARAFRTVFRCGTFRAHKPYSAVVNGDNCFGGALGTVLQLVRYWYNGMREASRDPRLSGHPELGMDWAARALDITFVPR